MIYPGTFKVKISRNKVIFSVHFTRKKILYPRTYVFREGTAEFLERLQLTHLVDLVVCGDDPFSVAKPDPHNARYTVNPAT